jgi:hypothetical protein
MATATESFKQWNRDRPNQLLALGVAVFVTAASLWTGYQAHSTTVELAKQRVQWQGAVDQLATFQQQFRIPTSTESAALTAESARIGALGVPPAERVSLMEFLVNLAEASSLTEVHVNFVPTDTTFVPPRAIGTEALNRAPYAVALDFTGSFESLVQFVHRLPPSVSLARLGASRHGNQAAYHILLSVYELNNGDKAG